MARPGLTNHRKFQRLARMLGNEPLARGVLEMMWDSAYECGEPYLGDSTDVEVAARWQGEPGKLVTALLNAGGDDPGFIEEVPDRPGRYQVHDLWDHAPDYVLKRRHREMERIERRNGLDHPKRRETDRRTADTDRTLDSDRDLAVCTPAPAPAPKDQNPPALTRRPARGETRNAAASSPPSGPVEAPDRDRAPDSGRAPGVGGHGPGRRGQDGAGAAGVRGPADDPGVSGPRRSGPGPPAIAALTATLDRFAARAAAADARGEPGRAARVT